MNIIFLNFHQDISIPLLIHTADYEVPEQSLGNFISQPKER